MVKVGITGQAGFVGTHLYNTLGLFPDEFERVFFDDGYFNDEKALRRFVSECQVIVHFAAMNRHPDPQVLYDTNVRLTQTLINALEKEQETPYVLFSSSIQESKENEYGRSKRECRELLERWAEKSGAPFTGLIIPNVFGPFGMPHYNSFIATFSHKLTHGENPQVLQDDYVSMIYVGNLCNYILDKIRNVNLPSFPGVEQDFVFYDFERKVTEILDLFEYFKENYVEKGYIPKLKTKNELNLFNTFRSYLDVETHFPVKLEKYMDERGSFIETAKLGIGGQVSLSTTFPDVTRGNHYHTHKIERFTIIKGKARLQMRKIGTERVIDYYLNGDDPSYVDIPIWYTHSITNIGKEDLYMQFWISEWYDPSDADTYFEHVTPTN